MDKKVEVFRQILYIKLKTETKEELIDFIEANKKIEGILAIDVSRHYKIIFDEIIIEDDTEYISSYDVEDLWGLYGLHGINAEQARGFEEGDVDIKVGIMDRGVLPHQEYNDLLLTGYDAINDSNETSDVVGLHGTYIAGIIASSLNSSLSPSVCRNVKLVPIQVVDDYLNCDAIVRAFNWAEDNDLDVVNCSFGWEDEEPSTTMIAAIENYQGVLVCSSGNSNSDIGNTHRFFSDLSQGYNTSSRIVSVGSIDKNGIKAASSNYSATKVSIFAPGVNIITTADNNKYIAKNGTSYAAPMVSGVAALVCSIYENNAHSLTRATISAKVKQLILNNARYNANLNGLCAASGEVDAYATLIKTPYLKTMSSFGYLGNWYNWRGKVNLKLPDNGWHYNDNNELVITSNMTLDFALNTTRVYNAWHDINATMSYELRDSSGNVVSLNETIYDTTVNVNLVSLPTYSNRYFTIGTSQLANGTYTLWLHCSATRNGDTHTQNKSFSFRKNVSSGGGSSSCITEGSLITLADGTQTAVENLTGNEQLLVWDMLNGTFSSAPILFIDTDPITTYDVIKLNFSDGTEVEVIDEHAFFDVTLNKYVFLRNDASQYIGHFFTKHNQMLTEMEIVQLVNVTITPMVTTAYSPVTYGHLCYYVNGMLSMPGNTESFINIFEVDSDTMAYDEDSMLQDIATYGLYTYEEFNSIIPLPEIVFYAFNGQYLKVAIGKGITTLEEIQALLDRYSVFLE